MNTRRTFLQTTSLGVLSASCGLAATEAVAEDASFPAVTKLTDFTQSFRAGKDWIGADAVYSLPLNDGRLLWIFDDTFVGQLVDGKRQVKTMVNNTWGMQVAATLESKPQFFIRGQADNMPASAITPDEGEGWLWFCGAANCGEQVVLFCQRVVKAQGESEAFGFEIVGTVMVVLGNEGEQLAASPLDWPYFQVPLPFTGFGNRTMTTWGAATTTHEGMTYIFGVQERLVISPPKKELIVARVKSAALPSLAEWEFLGKVGWQKETTDLAAIAVDVATELSVFYDALLKKWIMIHSEKHLGAGIMLRTADKPEGPWSEAQLIYRAPEAKLDKRIFCYAAKGHAALSKPGELVLSYVTNSHEFAHAVQDVRVYWPIFVRVDLGKVVSK